MFFLRVLHRGQCGRKGLEEALSFTFFLCLHLVLYCFLLKLCYLSFACLISMGTVAVALPPGALLVGSTVSPIPSTPSPHLRGVSPIPAGVVYLLWGTHTHRNSPNTNTDFSAGRHLMGPSQSLLRVHISAAQLKKNVVRVFPTELRSQTQERRCVISLCCFAFLVFSIVSFLLPSWSWMCWDGGKNRKTEKHTYALIHERSWKHAHGNCKPKSLF